MSESTDTFLQEQSAILGSESRPNLLLIDDQSSAVQLLHEIFWQGYEVSFASDGMQTLEMCPSTMVVADNDVGLPKNPDWKRSKTLGLTLVEMPWQHQFHDKIDLDRTNGTSLACGLLRGDKI